MARKHQPAASEALDEIQGAADRLGAWVQENLRLVVIAIVALLVAAGALSYMASSRARTEEKASAALAETRTAYLEAMGAPPGAIEVPQLANEDAARRIREEFAVKFGELGDAYPGTVSGALARMEVAQLAVDGGDLEGALAIFERILADGPPTPALRGLALQSAGQVLEEAERWEEAAARHRDAAEITDYPLHQWALADAARCLSMAGDRDGARALYARLDEEAPDLRLPDHQRVEKRELEATSSL
jgi:tetratricopeptide (TPR) repeat protein